jgi:flagellar assembly protein FliH
MDSRIQRYDAIYLRDFYAPKVISPVIPEADEVPQEAAPPPPPTFSESELEAAILQAKRDGYASGFEAGYSEGEGAYKQREADTLEIVKNLEHSLSNLQNDYQLTLNARAHEASELAYAIAKKIAGDALDKNMLPIAEALVQQCLPLLMQRPRFVIELHPEQLESVHEAIKSIIMKRGYEGDIIVRGSALLGLHDVRIDWSGGHAERNTETLWREIHALIHSYSHTPKE